MRKARGGPVVFPEMRPKAVELADGIHLAGYWLSQEWIQAERPLRLRLLWQARDTPSADYTTFIHLALAQEDGSIVRGAGFDRRPPDGGCPTNDWLPGEMIIDDAELNMPAELPPGDLFLAVGFYSLTDGRKLPVSNAVDNQILLGPLAREP